MNAFLLLTIVGCDKTVPAQLMGSISANKPVLPLITGPMLPGSHRGKRIGACTDCRNNWAAFRAQEIDIEEVSAINDELAPTVRVHVLIRGYAQVANVLTRLERVVSWEPPAQWHASLLHWA